MSSGDGGEKNPLKAKPGRPGWRIPSEVKEAVEEARRKLRENYEDRLGSPSTAPGVPDPDADPRLGGSHPFIEKFKFKDGTWRIERDAQGKIIRAYKGKVGAIRSYLTKEEKNSILEYIDAGSGPHLACKMAKVSIDRYGREMRTNKTFAAEVRLLENAKVDRAMLTIYNAAVNENVSAAVQYKTIKGSDKERAMRLKKARQDIEMREKEYEMKVRLVGASGVSSLPDMSVLGEDFPEYCRIHEKASVGEPLTDGEALAFGRMTAKLATPMSGIRKMSALDNISRFTDSPSEPSDQL